MAHFTPYSSLIGGALIGLAAALLMSTSGRIAGISGIFGGVLAPAADGRGWRLTFLLGLLFGCALVQVVLGPGPVDMVASGPALVLAGLLVRVGTRAANGCTSGHGVCGIARFSSRSIVATLTFMAAGLVTVFVVRHVIGG